MGRITDLTDRSNFGCSTVRRVRPCGVPVHNATKPVSRRSGGIRSKTRVNLYIWQDAATELLFDTAGA